MICKQCNSENSNGSRFCQNCGADLSVQETQTNTAAQPSEPAYSNNGGMPLFQEQPVSDPGRKLAIASLVCGILSFFCFGLVTGILAIVFGVMAKKRGCKSPMATAGIVIGIIGLVIQLIALVFSFTTYLAFLEANFHY